MGFLSGIRTASAVTLGRQPDLPMPSRAQMAAGALERVSRSIDAGFAYTGGSYGTEGTWGWIRKHLMKKDSARQSIMRDINFLIGESRWLSKYHPIVRNLVTVLVNWTVGTGFNHKWQLPKGWSKARKLAFDMAMKQWLETSQIDANRRYNVWQLDALIQRTIDVSGSIVVLHRKVRLSDMKDMGLRIPLQVETYEPDMIYNGPAPRDLRRGEEFLNGYALKNGKTPVALYLWSVHPGEGTGVPLRCDIYDSEGEEQVFHLFGPDRPGSLTGMPRAVSIVERAHNMADFISSFLDRMREDAKITRYIKMGANVVARPNLFDSGGAEGSANGYTQNGVETPGGGPTMAWTQAQEIGRQIGESLLDNNTVPMLPEGWDVKDGQMTPAQNFSDFYKELRRELATGMGVPYNVGANDAKGGSFSADKILLAGFKIECRQRQGYLVSGWREPLWRSAIRAAAAAGLSTTLDIPCQHRPDPFEMIEPAKEIAALIDKLNAGLVPWDDVVSELGGDPEETFERIVTWAERWAEAGYPLAPGLYKSQGGVGGQAAQPEDDAAADDAAAGDEEDA